MVQSQEGYKALEVDSSGRLGMYAYRQDSWSITLDLLGSSYQRGSEARLALD